MEVTKLSSKGQVIIPKAIRDRHQWRPGTAFAVVEGEEGVSLKPLRLFPPTRVEDGLGCAGYDGPAKTLEEMDKGVARALREAWSEGKGE